MTRSVLSTPLDANSVGSASMAGSRQLARGSVSTHRLNLFITCGSNNTGPSTFPRWSSRCCSRTSSDVTVRTQDGMYVIDQTAVSASVARYDIVINCAARTRVDNAEPHEENSRASNALRAEFLKLAAARGALAQNMAPAAGSSP